MSNIIISKSWLDAQINITLNSMCLLGKHDEGYELLDGRLEAYRKVLEQGVPVEFNIDDKD